MWRKLFGLYESLSTPHSWWNPSPRGYERRGQSPLVAERQAFEGQLVQVFGMTRPGIEPGTFRTWSGRSTTRLPRWVISFIFIKSYHTKNIFEIICPLFHMFLLVPLSRILSGNYWTPSSGPCVHASSTISLSKEHLLLNYLANSNQTSQECSLSGLFSKQHKWPWPD